jgi:hypothetical protein
MLLGNGTFGAMVWGGENVLRITLGRSDFWDHRGGIEWPEERTWKRVLACLEKGDEAGLRRLFYREEPVPGMTARPSVLPIGRWDIRFAKSFHLATGKLNLERGEASVSIITRLGVRPVLILADMNAPLLRMTFPQGIKPNSILRVPAWKYVGEYLESVGFSPPKKFSSGGLSGWILDRPADPPLCVARRIVDNNIYFVAVFGSGQRDAKRNAADLINSATEEGPAEFRRRNRNWWRAYWERVPKVEIPNERLQLQYNSGIYKFASFANPDGPPATLQGPWVEEYRMPPWSNDYHFNINVQMCYWPALSGNRLESLDRLFDMIESWKPVLRENARRFVGIADGILLPHANDDRGMNMGGFWTGAIDHGSTAWIARLMFRRYRFSMDKTFLRERAYPFMAGAMRVYEEMLERTGGTWALPVGPSPEYGGDAFDAWGKNASFQLACIHRLIEDLLESCRVLGIEPKAEWLEIREKLPKACLVGPEGRERIGLWEGKGLDESHRHHSHLAGIHPFDIIDPDDPTWRNVVSRTLGEWVARGWGEWSAWSFPWAAMIYTRLGLPDMAELLLEIWDRVFVNEGEGTMYMPQFPGLTSPGGGPVSRGERSDIMQMDSGMGAVAAISEMLLQSRQGVHHVFPGVPDRWEEASFDSMLADGAFLVSARLKEGAARWVQIKGLTRGTFVLARPWDGPAVVKRTGRPDKRSRGKVLRIALKKGETAEVVPCP